MVKPIVTYVGKIKEVENRKDLILVMDALEVCYILDYLGYPESDDDDPMDFSGLFVSVVDGDCEEVFVCVRLTPESLCGMFRNHCAPYPGITVRHRPDFAGYGLRRWEPKLEL